MIKFAIYVQLFWLVAANPVKLTKDDGIHNYRLPVFYKSIAEIVGPTGYPIEEHTVYTADGYILALHRIPHGRNNTNKTKRPVVLLQHGLLCSSSSWVLSTPENSIAYILSEQGYDVWMGNTRGNTYSRYHIWKNPDSREFWDFTWHDIGMLDLPAMIDYIIESTKEKHIHYIGHSQGTTAFFVMMSLHPFYNQKIKSMHALAPVAYLGNAKNPFVRSLAPFLGKMGYLKKILGNYEFLPNSIAFEMAGYALCKDGSKIQELCANILFLIAGYDHENLNRTMIPEIISTTPAGASVNQIIHYAQLHASRKFQMFDYGLLKNWRKYRSFTPPKYDLRKTIVPVVLHYGTNDWLSAVKDVHQIGNELGQLVKKRQVPHDKWNHLDFIWGLQAKELLYDHLLQDLDYFNSL